MKASLMLLGIRQCVGMGACVYLFSLCLFSVFLAVSEILTSVRSSPSSLFQASWCTVPFPSNKPRQL